jgi:hypothetical protein
MVMARQPLRRGMCRYGGSASSSIARRCSRTCTKGRRGNDLGCPQWLWRLENRGSSSGLPEWTQGLGHRRNEWEGSHFIATHHMGAMRAYASREMKVIAWRGGRASVRSRGTEAQRQGARGELDKGSASRRPRGAKGHASAWFLGALR